MTMRVLSVEGFFGGKDRNVCCQRHLEGQRGEWTSNWKRETLGGDTAKEKKSPGTAFGGGERNRPHAGWGGSDKPKNRNGAWPSSLRPATAGGPSPNGRWAEGPHRGPQSCIFNIVCIYAAHLPYGRVLCLWVPVGAPWAHPEERELGGRTSLLCPKGGPETSPCIAGSWVRAQSPRAPLPVQRQCPCQVGRVGP